jgi:hypothetical protein
VRAGGIHRPLGTFALPVSPDDVIGAFRDVLGREPESEAAVLRLCESADRRALYRVLFESHEYADRRRETLADAASPFLPAKRPALVFMHIPKTAGTSLHTRLTGKFPPPLVCPERFDRLHAYSLAELNRYRLFSGHFAYPVTRCIPGRRRVVITLLREPVARIVSAYRFLRAHKPAYFEPRDFGLMRLAHELEPAAFFADERVRQSPWFDNVAARMLLGLTDGRRWERLADLRLAAALRLPDDEAAVVEAATRVLREFAVVGTMERFEAFTARVGAAMGVDLGEDEGREQVLADLVQENPDLEPVEEVVLDAELLGLIEPFVRVDRRLYEHVAEAQS